jgi:hypothetical protein
VSTYRVEVLADSITSMVPRSGGQYAYQLEIVLDMSHQQRRMAVATMLAALPEAEAKAWIGDVFPELFVVPEPEVSDSSFGEFEAVRGGA